MKEIQKNWTVTAYNVKDEEIASFDILNRTEQEAEREAMGQLPSDCEDWTMVEKGMG